ncbi:mitochondrial carrier protein MTM1-like [Coffea eugenioides]|uniref:Mitochondrial carrier protein MTM1 isoform X1 n=1 Tax=Coffea arabica TaxID=13443 RepID=A0A6P6WJF9_COFAR|nr:mitochondrial carrier protein MTM1-like [Coffea arabica]XP_027158974.1 mitochondrial carrier protein MTM1-like [Coffea eugenioides]
MVVVGSSSSTSSSASRQGLPSLSRVAATASKTRSGGELDNMSKEDQIQHSAKAISDFDLSFKERAVSAAGAAFLSAIIVNPLDVVKTRLQAQAAGVPYHDNLWNPSRFETHGMLPDIKHNPSSTDAVFHAVPTCSSEGSRYKGTLDVLYRVVRQEGFTRLWRGTNASLALAVPSVGIYMPLYDIFRNFMEEQAAEKAPIVMPYVPLVAGSLARTVACITCYPVDLARTRMQAFRDHQPGSKPPGVLKTLVGVISPVKSTNNHQTFQTYRILWTGLGAQLVRDVPFSAICWSTLEPARRRILGLMGDKTSVGGVLGANFCAGFTAGSLAAAFTCPLDVARTWRQIEKDPVRALRMTTRQTLLEIWRDGGIKGLFTGVGPRVARAGPSVGIVVSFYEVVKYALEQRHLTQ